jgi:16S rRNA processing protein RimM
LPFRTDLVPVGRVGKPHGLDGSFVVDGPSEVPERFAEGATLYVDGTPLRVTASKQARGRPVIRLERAVDRGTLLAIPRAELPAAEEGAYYVFELVGLDVEEADTGRVVGRVSDVLDYPANDVLELDSGISLPLVEACVQEVDVEGGRIVVRAGFAGSE